MNVENTTVDTHSHYWPSEMVSALDGGKEWHGWRVERSSDGTEVLACSEGVAPFRSATLRESWPERIERRKAEEHVDVDAVMVPAFLWNYHMAPADATAYCRDVNDELAQLERDYPGRVRGFAVLPMQDVDRSLAEIDRAVNQLGLRAFGLGTHVEGRNFDDPDVVRILEAIVGSDAAIMMHPNFFGRIAANRLSRYYFDNSFGVPLEAGLAIMSIAYSGLMDRCPDARIGVTHGGGWLPYGIGRLLLRTSQGRDGGQLINPPDLYLNRFYYDILVHDEASLELLVRRVGADRLMIGTDYPFKGDIPGGAVNWVRGMVTLTTREKEMISGGNAHRFLKIDR